MVPDRPRPPLLLRRARVGERSPGDPTLRSASVPGSGRMAPAWFDCWLNTRPFARPCGQRGRRGGRYYGQKGEPLAAPRSARRTLAKMRLTPAVSGRSMQPASSHTGTPFLSCSPCLAALRTRPTGNGGLPASATWLLGPPEPTAVLPFRGEQPRRLGRHLSSIKDNKPCRHSPQAGTPSSDEPPHAHVQDQPDPDEVGDQRAPPVRHEGKGDPSDRHDPHVHADVHEHLEGDHGGHAHA